MNRLKHRRITYKNYQQIGSTYNSKKHLKTEMQQRETYRTEFLVEGRVRLSGEERTVKASDITEASEVVIGHQIGQVQVAVSICTG